MSQVWPATDDFAHGADPYGANVIGYLGAKAGGGYWARGRLHDGYGVGSAAVAQQDLGSGYACGFLRRQEFAADVRASLVYRRASAQGPIDASHFQAVAVMARVQGGALQGDGTADVRYEGFDGYAFTARRLTDTTVRFRLLRINGGSETVLAFSDDVAEDAGHFLNDVELRLTVTQNGSDVDLLAEVTNLALAPPLAAVVYQPGGQGNLQVTGTAAPSGPTPAQGTVMQMPSGGAPKTKGAQKLTSPVPVLSVTDSGGSVINGGGRCGFAIDREDDDGNGILSIGLASVFEVAEISGGTPAVVWRDEFGRAARKLGASVTDAFGASGRNLASDWSTDQASVASTPLKRATAEEAAEALSSLDLGHAVDLDGVSQYLTLSNPMDVITQPATNPAAVAISLAQWLRLDTNRNGNRFYDGASSSDGITWGWIDAGAGQFKLQVGFGDGFSAPVFESAAISETPYLGATWRWVLTYKANANAATGEGRLKAYAGRFGTATLLAEWTIPANVRPTWGDATAHFMGANFQEAGGADRFMDGVIDSTEVYFSELTAAQVAEVCNQFADPATFVGFGLAHAINFEVYNDNAPVNDEYKPWYPEGITDPADWWKGVGIPDTVDPGLVPLPASTLVHWSQRAADSASAQSRSIRAKLGAPFSTAAVVLRGTPSADPLVWDGYVLEVGPGSQASIALYRVLGGVFTRIAQQDAGASPISVSTGTYAKLELSVSQASGGPAGPVKLVAAVDDVTVVFEVVAGAGASLDLSGSVLDLDDARIASGAAEGFAGLVDTVSTFLDDWTAGTVTPPTPSPDSYPNVAVPPEDELVEGDLADVVGDGVDWTIEPRHMPMRVLHPFESAHSQRLVLGTYERRRFRLSKIMIEAERDAFVGFWDDHVGPQTGFAWDPGPLFPFGMEQAGTFHFLQDTLTVDRVGLAWQVQFDLEERRASAAPA